MRPDKMQDSELAYKETLKHQFIPEFKENCCSLEITGMRASQVSPLPFTLSPAPFTLQS